jgi:hypothetical protein
MRWGLTGMDSNPAHRRGYVSLEKVTGVSGNFFVLKGESILSTSWGCLTGRSKGREHT